MNTLTQIDKYSYTLRYYEKDLNRFLKPVSMFNFMQDVASMAAESHDFGITYIYSQNLAWFVLKYKLVIYEHINDMEEIEVKTESRGTTKLFAVRDFYFYHKGQVFAKASSLWALVDFETKKMVKPQDVLGDKVPAFEKREDDLDYDKIPAIDESDTNTLKSDFRIRFDDIDVNRHVNNACYPAWALETLDYDFKCNNRVKTIDIYFKKDIAYDGMIVSYANLDTENLISVHSIRNKNTNEELCSLKISWEKI